MLRNLLSNALKYTIKGGILLGCRRIGQQVLIQIWDTGLGIPEAELKSIFDEYHQVDNAARERSRGLGLGLSIVQRLGALLQHQVNVDSVYGKGSVFSIATRLCAAETAARTVAIPFRGRSEVAEPAARSGKILVIEDDPDIRQLLEMSLTEEGHLVTTARDGTSAIELVTAEQLRPDVILADYNLPNGATGLETVQKLRAIIGHAVPVVMVTGDTSTRTLDEIAKAGCLQLNKPMKLKDLNETIQKLLGAPAPAPLPSMDAAREGQATVYVIDDDLTICSAIRDVLEAECYRVATFNDGEAFLATGPKITNACLLLDANLPGMSGFDLLQAFSRLKIALPTIMFTGQGDVRLAVQAMQAGAFDFVEKPVSHDKLLASVARAVAQSKAAENAHESQQRAALRIASLTKRQRQIMELVLTGTASKNIAADLGISQRTVEKHRAAIMERTGTKSMPALARLAILGND
jgi:two-component system CheB/CheR fusion protein